MLQLAETEKHFADARKLFREYETWFGVSLCFQNFDDEVAMLPGKYASPEGRLYIVYESDEPVCCIGLRSLGDGVCEMKRLYLRDSARGKGIGVALIEKVISDAIEIGYTKMRLDTYPPKMGRAVSLYEAHGFYKIPPYYHNPHEGVLFMELTL
jgi:GNAT superfamily N-acetyltransferase